MRSKEKKEYPLLGKDDVCRLMELSYEMGKKGEKYSLCKEKLNNENSAKKRSKRGI